MRYQNLASVAHYLYDHYPYAVRAFVALIDKCGHRATLTSARNPRRWADREAEIEARFAEGDPSTQLPDDIRPLIAFLFPELPRAGAAASPVAEQSDSANG